MKSASRSLSAIDGRLVIVLNADALRLRGTGILSIVFYGWNCNVIGLDKIGLWKIKFERQMNTGHASMYQEASDRDWVEARLFFGIV